MKHVKLFEAFVNEAKKPTIEVSVSHAREAGDAFRDAYSKMGKMTSTNTFQFKNAEDAEEFAEYLMDYIDIPEDEIEGHNLDEAFVSESDISKEGYALNRLADDQVGGVPATEFQEEHNLDLDAIKRAITHTEELTRYELRDIIKGIAPKSKIKRFLKEYKK